jgi:methyl-CpG-binding domain protein 4
MEADDAAAARRRGDDDEAARLYAARLGDARASSTTHVRYALAAKACGRAASDAAAFEATLRQGLERAMREAAEDGVEDVGRDARARAIGGQLALSLCQRGANEDASDLLEFLGYSRRLSEEVLRYAEEGARERAPEDVARVYDDALDARALRFLGDAFARRGASTFWIAHDYYAPETGFFSYVHDVPSRRENKMDAVVDMVKDVASRAFPGVKRARYAEWWAHSRPHTDGHQLHFDSHDEGLGEVRHPICSAVVFVDGCCGGPTLVTNQKDTSAELASRAWLVYPKTGRVAVFNGDYLHGVVPGRVADDGFDPEFASRRRITLMISFWEDMDVHHSWTPAGSARPFPPRDAPGVSWRSRFDFAADDDFAAEAAVGVEVLPVVVERPWDRVRRDDGDDDDDASALPAYDDCFQGF